MHGASFFTRKTRHDSSHHCISAAFLCEALLSHASFSFLNVRKTTASKKNKGAKTSGRSISAAQGREKAARKRKLAASNTLVEQAEAKSECNSRLAGKRRLSRRETEQAVSKCLADNFDGFTTLNTDTLLMTGLRCRSAFFVTS